MSLPTHANVIIIGGGIIGCSIAYHLTKVGISDVLLLERKQLCCGTTWHSVGSVAELRGNRRMTELARYTAELYRSLEAETGQATGYKKTGSIMLALNKERLMEMERSAALARAFGQEAEMISIADVKERCPQVVTDDALAGFYLPTDGRTNPIDTTHALAKGARMGGATIRENVEVIGLDVINGEVRGVLTEQGPVQADIVVLAAGMWAREFAAGYGVSLPLQAAEHFYAVTENIEGLQRSMPFIRVPDESTYYKEDAGKLLFGCLEKRAKPWALDGIPKDFCFDSLPEDLDHFEPILDAAVRRFPLLENAGIQLFFNGPESFTPDGNALMGETPELKNLFVACGLNTVGVMSGGAMGKMMAEWIRDRRRPEGFAEFDVARLSGFQSGRSYLRDRTVEALGVLYDVGWPNREYVSGRGGRRSPLHHEHIAANAIMGGRAGWEVPLVYAPSANEAVLKPSYGRQNWTPWAAQEVQAAEETAILFDLSGNAKLKIEGEENVAKLNRLSPSNGLTSVIWTNEAGKIRSSVSVLALSDTEAFILSSPGSERLHSQWLESRGLTEASIQQVSASYAQFLLLGPQAASHLEAAGVQLGEEPFQTVRIGYAPAVIARTSLNRSAGWVILVSTEFAAHAFEALQAQDRLKLGGLYALEAMRVAASQPAWPSELGDTVTPLEAGLAGSKGAKRTTALVRITLRNDSGALYGQEGILRDGKSVGLTTSGAWCRHAGVPIALGYVSDPKGVDSAWVAAARFAIDMPGGPADTTLELVGEEN